MVAPEEAGLQDVGRLHLASWAKTSAGDAAAGLPSGVTQSNRPESRASGRRRAVAQLQDGRCTWEDALRGDWSVEMDATSREGMRAGRRQRRALLTAPGLCLQRTALLIHSLPASKHHIAPLSSRTATVGLLGQTLSAVELRARAPLSELDLPGKERALATSVGAGSLRNGRQARRWLERFQSPFRSRQGIPTTVVPRGSAEGGSKADAAAVPLLFRLKVCVMLLRGTWMCSVAFPG